MVGQARDFDHVGSKARGTLEQVNHALIFPAAAADEQQARRGLAALLGKLSPDGEKEGEVLAGLDCADIDEVGTLDRGQRAVLRCQECVLYAQGHDVDAGLAPAEAPEPVAGAIGGVLRIDKDELGQLGDGLQPSQMAGCGAG